jgi:hypothetical protein
MAQIPDYLGLDFGRQLKNSFVSRQDLGLAPGAIQLGNELLDAYAHHAINQGEAPEANTEAAHAPALGTAGGKRGCFVS